MNVPTIKMSKDEARHLYNVYRSAPRKNREDRQIQKGYWHLAQGKTLIDVQNAMRVAGADVNGYPRLAICRADATRCTYFNWGSEAQFAMSGVGNQPNALIKFQQGVLPRLQTKDWRSIEAFVPIIPVTLRPPVEQLPKHFILWEAVWVPAMPKDPYLLKHRYGFIYEVVASWDLTDLERAVMAQTRLRQQ